MFIENQLDLLSRAAVLMRERDDLMLMHQQEDRLMRLGLMQLNERVRRCSWISEAGSRGAESSESPSKKMRRRSYDCGYSYKDNCRRSESCEGDGREQDPPRQHRYQQRQRQPKQLPRQQQPRRSGRRVRFSETSQMVILPRRTNEDIVKCWYTPSDVADFKRLAKLRAVALGATRTAGLARRAARPAAATRGVDCRAPSSTPGDAAGDAGGGTDAARGAERPPCPAVAGLLLRRRRAALRRVLEEQSRMGHRAAFDAGGDDVGTEARACAARACAAREASAFSGEWSRRVLGLHREAP